MPTVDEVAALIDRVADRQIPEAQQILQQMVAREKSKQRFRAAQQLEYVLHKWQRQPMHLVELPRHLKSMAWDAIPEVTLDDLMLDTAARQVIDRFLLEWHHVTVLSEAGLTPDNRLLLSGTPGNGKTSVAYAIAHRLSLPFIAIKTSQVMDSLLGETAKNINAFFQYANEQPCVLFFDEMDAITSARVRSQDSAGKEYNGLVTTFLVQLDRFSPQSIVVAATNLAEHVDPAIMRRFSHVVILSPPTPDQMRMYLMRYERQHGITLVSDLDTVIHGPLADKSWADVERYCQQMHKAQILARYHSSEEVSMSSIYDGTLPVPISLSIHDSGRHIP